MAIKVRSAVQCQIWLVTIESVQCPPLHSKTSQILCDVFLQDVNDNHPLLDATNCSKEVNIYENGKAGQFLCRMRATDKDFGPSGKIEYILVGKGRHLFHLNRRTGVLTTARSLDREAEGGSRYNLTIRARDHGEPRLDNQTYVIVNVLDKNDNRPLFNYHYGTIHRIENLRGPESLTLLRVRDLDRGPNQYLRFSIVAGNIGNLFLMDAGGNLVIGMGELDRENISRYNLTIQVCDTPLNLSEALCDRKNISVVVDDVNDETPKFTAFSRRHAVREDAAVGTPVMQATAVDRDLGASGQVYYTMNDVSGRFKIHRKTGVVSIKHGLDYELQSSYNLTIHAKDSDTYGQRSSAVQVRIDVLDINDFRPSFMQDNYVVVVSEKIAPGQRVFSMIATDRDSGANARISYSISTPTLYFQINKTTGLLTTRRRLAQRREYVLTVRAADHGIPSLSGSAEITVKIVEHSRSPPRFLQDLYTVFRRHGLPANSGITTMKAISDKPLKKGSLNYTLGAITPRPAKHSFAIDRLTGEIRTTKEVVLDASTSYRVVVVARDTRDLTIPTANTVLKLQWEPAQYSFMHFVPDSSYDFSVLENAGANTFVGRIKARSDFKQDKSSPRYRLEVDSREFRVDSRTGRLYTTMPLDHETTSSYTLSVLATDQTNLSRPSIATVSVEVLDQNEHTPSWTKTHTDPIQHPENITVGSTVASLLAEDKDLDAITYRLLDSFSNTFGINDDGRVVLRKALDYESRSNYFLRVIASDGEHQIATTMEIIVTDINDNSPRFSSPGGQRIMISELAKVGYAMVRVSATDADSGANGKVRYYQANFNPRFSLHPTKGDLYLAQKLPYHKHGENIYTINVLANDSGNPVRETLMLLEIEVYDANDHTPEFHQPRYKFHVKEDVEEPAVIGTVNATDGDDGTNAELIYDVVGGSDVFSVTGGSINLLSPLDRELVASYEINVSVSDKGDPPMIAYAPVVIVVDDVNDNPPVFAQPNYFVSVKIHHLLESNGSLLQVLATDEDENGNANIFYTIQQQQELSFLYINRFTGEIFFDLQYRDSASELLPLNKGFKIQVVAKERQRPFHSTVVDVTIVIFSEKWVLPVFGEQNYVASVAENVAPGHFVVNITAVQPETVPGKAILYAIEAFPEQPVAGLFEIEKETGRITVGRVALDYEETPVHKFRVKAIDKTRSDQVSYTNVTVHVLNYNEARPSFEQKHYTFTVGRDDQVGSVIGQIQASDVDRDEIHYSFTRLERPHLHGFFDLDNKTGKIAIAVEHHLLSDQLPMNGTVLASDGSGEDKARISIRLASQQQSIPDLASSVQKSSSSNIAVVVAIIVSSVLIIIFLLIIIVAVRRKGASPAMVTSPFIQSPSLTVGENAKNNLSAAIGESEQTTLCVQSQNNCINDSPKELTPVRRSPVQISRKNSYHGSSPSQPPHTYHKRINNMNVFGSTENYGETSITSSNDLATHLFGRLAELEAEEHNTDMDALRHFEEDGPFEVQLFKMSTTDRAEVDGVSNPDWGSDENNYPLEDGSVVADVEALSDIVDLCGDLLKLPVVVPTESVLGELDKEHSNVHKNVVVASHKLISSNQNSDRLIRTHPVCPPRVDDNLVAMFNRADPKCTRWLMDSHTENPSPFTIDAEDSVQLKSPFHSGPIDSPEHSVISELSSTDWLEQDLTKYENDARQPEHPAKASSPYLSSKPSHTAAQLLHKVGLPVPVPSLSPILGGLTFSRPNSEMPAPDKGHLDKSERQDALDSFAMDIGEDDSTCVS